MEKDEATLALMKAYEDGYSQAFEDVARAFIRTHKDFVESSAVSIGKLIEEQKQKATADYFKALTKGKVAKG